MFPNNMPRGADRCMKIYKIITLLIIFMVMFGCFMNNAAAEEKFNNSNVSERPVLYYFWAFCPLCDEPDLNLINIETYPIDIEIFEIVYNQDNLKKYHQMREELGIETIVFPTFIFNDQYWLGFSPLIEEDIIKAIEYALYEIPVNDEVTKLSLPIIGEIDLDATPILLTTLLLSFLDGFNPCSFFVLTFLLAIIVHSASRKRIFLVGITFLLVTSLVYGLFILGALNVMLFAAQLFWIRNVVAALVIVLGIFSIKDFFIYKKGVSVSIPDSYKAKYYQQVRKVFYTKSIIPMIAATPDMALGIALIELPCTAGFPFIWASIIAGLDLSPSQYVFLFAVYLTIYLIDELILFFLALIRMRTLKLTEERGLLLKLIAGSLMLVLGLVLLLKPEYMQNIFGILMAFGATLLVVFLMYLIRRLTSARSRKF